MGSSILNKINRRNFSYKILCALGSVPFCRELIAQTNLPTTTSSFKIEAGGNYLLAGHRTGLSYEESTIRNFLGIYRISDGVSHSLPVKTDIHSIVKRANAPNELLTLSKNKPQATFFPSIFNLGEQKLIDAGPSRVFSGHGVYSPDGKILITSETNTSMETGVLSIRDAVSHKVLESIDSGGIFPHEMKFVDATKLLVANGGSPAQEGANLSVLDLNNRKVLDSHLPPEFGPGVRHFVVDSLGNLVIGTWITYSTQDPKRPAAQVLSSRLGRSASIKVVDLGKEFRDLATREPTQFLSVALHVSSNQAVLTASGADTVVVVECSTGSVTKVLHKIIPTSVASCYDPDLMAVSDAKGYLQFLDMRTLTWRKERELSESPLTGSHMELLQVG